MANLSRLIDVDNEVGIEDITICYANEQGIYYYETLSYLCQFAPSRKRKWLYL